MRPFEALTLLLAALSPLPFILPARYHPRRLRWFPLAAALALVVHLFLEGYRWQMLPAYFLVVVLAILTFVSLLLPQRPVRSRALRVSGGALALLWLMLAIALPFALPVPRPKAPTGPYAVGTQSAHLVDENRPEIFNEEVAHRELMVQVWYPAEIDASSERAPFIDRVDVAGPAIATRLGLPSFILGHLDLVRTDAYLDAPPVAGGPFPLLIFSHGLRGLRAQNTSLMQELASHGYIVAAIDHPYANVLTVFPDGRVVFYDQDAVMPPGMNVTQAGARLVEVWAEDIGFVVQELAEWGQRADHLLYAKIDASRLGLLGHSTGAGATIQACATLPDCEAVLALDGWIQPVAPAVLQSPYEPALMLISAPDWLGPENRALGEQLYEQRRGDGYLLTVEGTVHFDYTDIPLMSPVTSLIGLSGDVEGVRMVSIINNFALAFFDQTLRGEPAPLLEEGGNLYDEVSFGP